MLSLTYDDILCFFIIIKKRGDLCCFQLSTAIFFPHLYKVYFKNILQFASGSFSS